MSCPIGAEAVEKLKQFVTICQSNPDLLHLPQLSFFKSFIESFGGKVPAPRMSAEPNAQQAQPEPKEEAPESDEESDLEIDMTGCVEPDEISPDHNMGDVTKEEVSEEEQDKADEKRREAMAQFSEGNIEKSIELFTEAIVINPTSALLFAKRGQAYLKLNKPNACIKDCTRALELNCDSVSGYKFRGKAYRLLGEWEKAAKDLRQACNIDFDEQTDEWLKEVEPNAKKIEQHRLKKERKEKEKKAQKARAPKPEAPPTSTPGGPPPTGAGPGGLFDLFKDPEILKAFEDPEVAAAFQDITSNFSNFTKYQNNPKVMNLLKKLSAQYTGGGMPDLSAFAGGMPGGFGGGMPGGFAGMPGFGGPKPTPPNDDDHLD